MNQDHFTKIPMRFQKRTKKTSFQIIPTHLNLKTPKVKLYSLKKKSKQSFLMLLFIFILMANIKKKVQRRIAPWFFPRNCQDLQISKVNYSSIHNE